MCDPAGCLRCQLSSSFIRDNMTPAMTESPHPLVVRNNQVTMADNDHAWRALGYLLLPRSELSEIFEEADYWRRLRERVNPPFEVHHESVQTWVMKTKQTCISFLDMSYKIWAPIIAIMYMINESCIKQHGDCKECDAYEKILYYSSLTLFYKTLGCISFILTLVICE